MLRFAASVAALARPRPSRPGATVRLSLAPHRYAEVSVERRADGRLVGVRRIEGAGERGATHRLPLRVRSGDVLRVFVRYAPRGNALFKAALSIRR
jgi:hypothetical protein